MVLAEVSAGLSALSAAYEIAKGLKDINDQVRLNAAIIELQAQILAAQEGAGAARRQIDELEHQLDRRNKWAETAAKYALQDFGSNTFAYAFVKEDGDPAPAHCVCPRCFEEEKRSILQRTGYANGQEHYRCAACDLVLHLGTYQAPPRNPPGNGFI